MHEVGFSQPYTAMEEQRVVNFAGVLGNGGARRMGELIVRANDEGLECVPRIHPVGEGFLVRIFLHRRGRDDLAFGFRCRDVRNSRIYETDFPGPLEREQNGGAQRAQIVVLDPIAVDVVWHPQSEVLRADLDRFDILEPAIVNIRGHLGTQGRGDFLPEGLQLVDMLRLIHRH